MKKELGVWIDHREAVIAFVSIEGAEIKRVESDMEKHVKFSGGAAEVTAEDMRDRRFANHLSKYYDQVIACIRDADSILILGPGEAKGELEKRIGRNGLKARIPATEATDKMTDRQISAKVREQLLA